MGNTTIAIQLPVDVLRRGSGSKVDVAILQALLAGHGFLGWEIDGEFGPITEQAVKAFQARAGLPRDGVVGIMTWTKLAMALPGENSEDAVTDKTSAGDDGRSPTESDYEAAAAELGVDVATIKAICEVESLGSGFLDDGRPKILFEGHIFWRQLIKHGINPKDHVVGNEDILYERWTKEHYLGGAKEYTRLKRAVAIHPEAALESTSWGMFQIMGFNYQLAGFENIKDFVDAMYDLASTQLMAFCEFVKNTRHSGLPLNAYLQTKNWPAFACGYNGAGYQANRYDEKLAAAYSKYRGA